MPHQIFLSHSLPIFIIVLIIFCNSSTCSASSRLLPPKPESPLLPNSAAPPLPHHEWPFTNFPRHEQSSTTQPKTAKFLPWLQDPTKAEEPIPPEHHSSPKILRPLPKVPCFHESKPIPKPKWPIPGLTPKVEKPTPMKHQVLALPPLLETPSLLSPELAPMPSVALVPSSAEP